MSIRRIAGFFVLIAGVQLAAQVRPAFADIPAPPTNKPGPADEATAKKSFDSGLKLYGEGAFAEALVAFEASYKLGGRPSALKNIAQCHRNLKHFVDAYEAYEQLMTLHGTALPIGEKKPVEQAMEELSVLTGTLTLVISETDAEVSIDQKPVGKSPLKKPIRRVAVGSHQVKVTKAGFEPFDQIITVGSQDAKKVDITLSTEKKTGRVVVREPSGRDVHVFIDGEDKGPAPFEGDIPAGEHTVEARGPKFAATPRKITIVAKEKLDVSLDAATLTGHLRVTTIPATATITIDDRVVGTGAWEGDLPEGKHQVEAGLAGHPPQVREVTVTRGQNILQEIPIVGALSTAKTTNYKGVYVCLSLQPYFMLGGYTSNHANNVATTAPDRLVIGGGGTIRGGYSFGWISAEVVGAFMVEHREQNQAFVLPGGGAATQIEDKSTAPNVFFGIGPRITSKDDLFRVTVAITPGIALRNYNFNRTVTFNGATGAPAPTPPGPNSVDFTPGYTAFALNAEAGLLLGSTPGTKFFLGAHAWLDFPPEDIVAGPDTVSAIPNSAFRSPGRGIAVVNSTQFFVGPVLGLRIGN